MFTLEQIREFILNNPVFSVDYPNRFLQNLGGQGDGISLTVLENPNLITVHFGAVGGIGNLNLARLEFVYEIIGQYPAQHIFMVKNFRGIERILPPYIASLVLFMHNRHPQHDGIGNNHAHYEALHGPLWLPPMN